MASVLVFNNKKFREYGLGSALVLSSVVAIQGYKQDDAIIGFILGWLIIARALVNRHHKDSAKHMSTYVGPVAAIMVMVSAIMHGKMERDAEKGGLKIAMLLMFVVGWSLVALSAADSNILNIIDSDRHELRYALAALVVVGVVGSMKFRLPAADKVGRTRNEGMIMFTLSWVLLVLLGSTRPDVLPARNSQRPRCKIF